MNIIFCLGDGCLGHGARTANPSGLFPGHKKTKKQTNKLPKLLILISLPVIFYRGKNAVARRRDVPPPLAVMLCVLLPLFTGRLRLGKHSHKRSKIRIQERAGPPHFQGRMEVKKLTQTHIISSAAARFKNRPGGLPVCIPASPRVNQSVCLLLSIPALCAAKTENHPMSS